MVPTFDATLGDFEKADVLIEGKKIVAVQPDINATTTVIDASKAIVLRDARGSGPKARYPHRLGYEPHRRYGPPFAQLHHQ